MRTFNQHPDSLVLLLIKLSLFFLLSLIFLNSVHVKAQATKKWIAKDSLSELRLKVRQIYNSQIGIREKQPNSGPAVEQYLRYVNLPKGNPWCAAFVCWVYGRAGVGNPKSGWTGDLFKERWVIWRRGEPRTRNQEPRPVGIQTDGLRNSNFNGNGSTRRFAYPPQAGAGGGLNTNSTPTTGDIFGLFFPEKGRVAHVGFIDQWDGTWLVSVEGNTNVSGSREGDGVYRKRRLVRSVYKVARYIRQEPN